MQCIEQQQVLSGMSKATTKQTRHPTHVLNNNQYAHIYRCIIKSLRLDDHLKKCQMISQMVAQAAA